MFLVKKKKANQCKFRQIVFIWGTKENVSCLGHFVSPLLSSVTSTKWGGEATGRFSPEPRVQDC